MASTIDSKPSEFVLDLIVMKGMRRYSKQSFGTPEKIKKVVKLRFENSKNLYYQRYIGGIQGPSYPLCKSWLLKISFFSECVPQIIIGRNLKTTRLCHLFIRSYPDPMESLLASQEDEQIKKECISDAIKHCQIYTPLRSIFIYFEQ